MHDFIYVTLSLIVIPQFPREIDLANFFSFFLLRKIVAILLVQASPYFSSCGKKMNLKKIKNI